MHKAIKQLSVTKVTDGGGFDKTDALELAAGLLFTEGIERDAKEIAAVDHCFIACAENKENVIQVSLTPGVWLIR